MFFEKLLTQKNWSSYRQGGLKDESEKEDKGAHSDTEKESEEKLDSQGANDVNNTKDGIPS